MQFNLIATAAFGLEKIVGKELKELGFDDIRMQDSRVNFSGDEMDCAIANVHLRCADRILINMGEFTAVIFEELFQGVKKIEWGEILPKDAFMHVSGKSVRSTLHSVPDCQSIAKKAIIESMKRYYGDIPFKEDGDEYKIEVGILKDTVTMTIDTSGSGLHKRGYRKDSGAAPMKETLAAALVYLSGWDYESPVIDPFCGSGTILIEAAMMARNIVPGLIRTFASENWPLFKEEGVYENVRDGAKRKVRELPDLKLYGYDKDSWVLKTAKHNAEKAGVFENIYFRLRDIADFTSGFPEAYIITNPPYGERLEDEKETGRLMEILGTFRRRFPEYHMSVFTAYKDFEKKFGEKAEKNRKLYNGRLLSYLYQYNVKVPGRNK